MALTQAISGKCLGKFEVCLVQHQHINHLKLRRTNILVHNRHSLQKLSNRAVLLILQGIFFRNPDCVLREVPLSDLSTTLIPCSTNIPLLLYSSSLSDENRALCNVDSVFVDALS
jgi:hypothetical protein